jgi:hypothetical protein
VCRFEPPLGVGAAAAAAAVASGGRSGGAASGPSPAAPGAGAADGRDDGERAEAKAEADAEARAGVRKRRREGSAGHRVGGPRADAPRLVLAPSSSSPQAAAGANATPPEAPALLVWRRVPDPAPLPVDEPRGRRYLFPHLQPPLPPPEPQAGAASPSLSPGGASVAAAAMASALASGAALPPLDRQGAETGPPAGPPTVQVPSSSSSAWENAGSGAGEATPSSERAGSSGGGRRADAAEARAAIERLARLVSGERRLAPGGRRRPEPPPPLVPRPGLDVVVGLHPAVSGSAAAGRVPRAACRILVSSTGFEAIAEGHVAPYIHATQQGRADLVDRVASQFRRSGGCFCRRGRGRWVEAGRQESFDACAHHLKEAARAVLQRFQLLRGQQLHVGGMEGEPSRRECSALTGSRHHAPGQQEQGQIENMQHDPKPERIDLVQVNLADDSRPSLSSRNNSPSSAPAALPPSPSPAPAPKARQIPAEHPPPPAGWRPKLTAKFKRPKKLPPPPPMGSPTTEAGRQADRAAAAAPALGPMPRRITNELEQQHRPPAPSASARGSGDDGSDSDRP